MIGQYELSVVPRSMFAVDGSMLHCQLKSSLLHIMENFPKVTERVQRLSEVVSSSSVVTYVDNSVAIVDAMAELQSFDKPDCIKNCRQLADKFTSQMIF